MLYDNMEIPEYEKYMYMKGYTPEQILQSCRESMKKKYYEKKDDEITVKVEINK